MFNALTGSHGETGNRPFVTIDPNMGQAMIPDSRLDLLTTLPPHATAKKIPTHVELWDIAGLVKGAGAGEGLGNKFLAHIRECNALIHMVRCYENELITHVEGAVNPLADIAMINNELVIADLQALERQAGKMKGTKDTIIPANVKKEVLSRCEELLMEEQLLVDCKDSFNAGEWDFIMSCGLLTAKEMLFVCNVDEDSAASELSGTTHPLVNLVREKYPKKKVCCLSADLEMEATHSGEEGAELLEGFGIAQSQAEGVTQAVHDALGYKTFFTAGPLEVRSWTCKKADNVREASAAIHSDFPHRLTKTDLTPFQTYVEEKGEGKAKSVGPNHVSDDGDVLLFHIDQKMKIKK